MSWGAVSLNEPTQESVSWFGGVTLLVSILFAEVLRPFVLACVVVEMGHF